MNPFDPTDEELQNLNAPATPLGGTAGVAAPKPTIDPAIADYLARNAAKAPAPQPTNTFGTGQAVATGFAGLGDALAAAGGQHTTHAADAITLGKNVREGNIQQQETERQLALQKEKDDPMSDTSKTYQSIAGQMLGKDATSMQGLSATKIAELLPTVEKFAGTLEAGKSRVASAEIAEKGREASLAQTRMMFGDRMDMQNQKQWTDFMQKNDPATASGRTVVGQLGRANMQAQRALDMLTSQKDITKEEAGSVMGDMAGIFAGGPPSDLAFKHQEYNTAYGKIKDLMQFWSGIPQGALTDAVKQRLVNDLGTLKNTSTSILKTHNDQLENSQRGIISKHADEWKSFRDSIENPQSATHPGAGSPGPAGTGGVSGKPKTVTQNGNTYTYNQQTEQYE